MQLHELIAVTATADPDVYIAQVDITDTTGERYTTDYGSTPNDTFGLAPAIREAVDQWIADEKPVGVYEPPALAALKATLKARLDADAETERLKYITAGAGQAMEYQQAAAEAEALLSAVAADPEHEPDPLQYPMLAASVGIDGDTLVDVATTVATMHGQWRAIGSAIRAARLGGKLAIDAAATAEQAQAAFDAVVWPQP